MNPVLPNMEQFWYFRITTNMWPVYAVSTDKNLAIRTLDSVPGGHVFGPFFSAEDAISGADSVMAADEAAMGGQ